MPPERAWRFRLEDIVAAIEAIDRYTTGLDLESFSADSKTRDAVIMNFAVIGEAANRIPEAIRAEYRDVPWAEMILNRNVMIHMYFGLKSDILWSTIQKDLPPLRARLREILKLVQSFDDELKQQ